MQSYLSDMEEESYRRIVVDPEVMVGKPIIKGTRIPVDAIIRAIAQGVSIQELLEDYPNLTREDIKASLEYAAELTEGEDIFPIIIKKE